MYLVYIEASDGETNERIHLFVAESEEKCKSAVEYFENIKDVYIKAYREFYPKSVVFRQQYHMENKCPPTKPQKVYDAWVNALNVALEYFTETNFGYDTQDDEMHAAYSKYLKHLHDIWNMNPKFTYNEIDCL